MNKIYWIFLLSIVCTACGGNDDGDDGNNNPNPVPTLAPTTPPVSTIDYFYPLTGNLGTHDPTFIKEGDTWYEFQTGAGIYGKTSSDGLHWLPLPSLLTGKLSWWESYVPNQVGNDVWAPDVRVYNGRTWLYYSISTFGSRVSAIGLLSADDIASDNWQDEGLVISSNESDDFNAIDPNLSLDADGNPWLVLGSWSTGIKLTQLDSDEQSSTYMKPIGTLFAVASRSGGIEGPGIIYRNGYYYLFVSFGLCCQGVDSTYRIVYGRATDITGPYLDQDGIDMMDGGGSLLEDGDARWIGPGGQDVANIDGTDIMAFHTYDAASNGDPILQMATLLWDADDWPYLDPDN